MLLAQTWTMSFSATVLLAAMATLGYVLGRRRSDPQDASRSNSRHEIMRALAVAQELEAIAYRLRKSMAFHVPAIVKFNTKLRRWERNSDVSWHELCDRADEVLKPALRLSTEISHAYADLLQQMTHLSTFAELRTDPLTGVANRRAFDDSLEKLLAEHQQPGEAPLSIAMLDLDHFKRINDRHGHPVGDRALKHVASLLQAAMRASDSLGRFGGEEFVLLLPNTPIAQAEAVAEKVRLLFESSPLVNDATPVALSASIGIAQWRDAADDISRLLSRADAALFQAKVQGRNRLVTAMDAATVAG